MEKYKYVLFDLDGTLTDPKVGITKSVQYSLKHLGILEENLENLEKFIGPPLYESYEEFYGLDRYQVQEAVARYRERFTEVGMYENEMYEGMEGLLKQLKNLGVKIAIASSKPTFFVEKICEYFKISQYFDYLIGSFLDGRRTAKDEVIEEVIDLFGVTDLSEMIMVGDRKFDIQGAHTKGIKAIGVTYGYGGYEELSEAGADFIVDSVDELKLALI